MKATLTLLPLLFALCLSAQTQKIKVKKVVTQDKMTSVATISGLYYGATTPQQLLRDKKIRVSNNQDNWKIISYTFTFFTQGDIRIFIQATDSLTPTIIEELFKRDPKKYNKIYLDEIKAVNSRMDTIYLNPIDLKLNLD